MSRDKGQAFERQVANILKEVFPDARRGRQDRDSNFRDTKEADIEGTGPYWVECKARKGSPPVYPAIDQAKADMKGSRPDAIPLIVTKKNNHGIYVTMPIDHFMELLRDSQRQRDLEAQGRKDSDLPFYPWPPKR